MKPRHEWKHEINYCDMLIIRQRLSAIMKRDEHAIDGKYIIRSLYFDNASDKALREKLDGVNIREKFRIRYYNNDTSLIHLEKKSKEVTPPDGFEMPEGMSPLDEAELSEDAQENMPGNMGDDMRNSSDDVLLRYIDDNAESYLDIFENAKTDIRLQKFQKIQKPYFTYFFS